MRLGEDRKEEMLLICSVVDVKGCLFSLISLGFVNICMGFLFFLVCFGAC